MNNFPLIPVSGTKNKVFITPDEGAEKKSAGGIIIVEQKVKKPTSGIVLAISIADENGVKPTLKVGDHVMFNEYAGLDADYGGINFLVMKEYDIYAKLKK